MFASPSSGVAEHTSDIWAKKFVGRDLRRALLALEVARVQQYPFSDSQPVMLADWELYVQVQSQRSTPPSFLASLNLSCADIDLCMCQIGSMQHFNLLWTQLFRRVILPSIVHLDVEPCRKSLEIA